MSKSLWNTKKLRPQTLDDGVGAWKFALVRAWREAAGKGKKLNCTFTLVD